MGIGGGIGVSVGSVVGVAVLVIRAATAPDVTGDRVVVAVIGVASAPTAGSAVGVSVIGEGVGMSGVGVGCVNVVTVVT